MSITSTFHVVDCLPHRASVMYVDEGGEIHTYLARNVELSELAADLGWALTAAAQTGDYARTASMWAAALLPLTGLAAVAAQFHEQAAPLVGS